MDKNKKEKAVKGEIKYSIQLNEEQKLAKQIILDNELIIITGNAGTGKTTLVSQTVLDMLFKRTLEEVLLTRSLVETDNDSMGYLPGDKDIKLSPYIAPFKESLKKVYSEHKEKIDKMFDDKIFVAHPINFIRGTNIDPLQVLICDETQNCSKAQVLAMMTRITTGGKLILLGDTFQCDTKDPNNGLVYAIEMAKRITEIKHIKLKENHRSGIVAKILEYEYGKL